MVVAIPISCPNDRTVQILFFTVRTTRTQMNSTKSEEEKLNFLSAFFSCLNKGILVGKKLRVFSTCSNSA